MDVPRVVCLGLAAVDIVIVVDELPTWEGGGRARDFRVVGGGPAATAAVAATKLGVHAGLIGTHGDDQQGIAKREELANAGVELSQMQQITGPEDQLIIVYVHQSSGERLFVPVSRSPAFAAARLDPARIDETYLRRVRYLLIDGHHHEAALYAARIVRDSGGEVVLDAGTVRAPASGGARISDDRRLLVSHCDYLISGGGFCSALTGISDRAEAVCAAREFGPRVVIETAGELGSCAASGQESFHTPAHQVQTVDTTGAGDVFHGASLAALANGWPLRRVVSFATAAAAISCTRLGGRAGCPTMEEVESFLARAADT